MLQLTRRAAARTLTALALTGATLALPAAPAMAAGPQVTVTTTATNPTSGVTLRVEGTGFSAVTNPGDMGVYVGLAPAGGMPDVSSQSGSDSFAAAAWVRPDQMPSGSFTATLTAAPERLDPTKAYAVYTWQAHTHSNATQDTETPLAIDWAAMKRTPTVAASWQKKPTTTAKKGQLKVAVSGGATPTGSVTVTLRLKGSSKTKTKSAALAGGAALVKLPKLAAGKWTLTVSYAGDARHHTAQSTLTAKVRPKPKTRP